MSTTEKTADLLVRNWRGLGPNDGRRMADDLNRAHLLAPDLPDVAYGLAIDGNGTRSDDTISCALLSRRVALIADSEGNAARVVLDAKECRELGAWLLAAAADLAASND